MLSISIEFPNIFKWTSAKKSKVDLVFGGQIRPNVLKKQIKWYLNVFSYFAWGTYTFKTGEGTGYRNTLVEIEG